MDFYDLIRKRYSVRSYKADAVEKDKLERILEAAQLAPTAANLQPFQLIVIHTENRKSELRKIYSSDWFVQAPIIICACGVLSKTWVRKDGRSYNDVDIAIVMDHLILAAAYEGLGTCWIAAFDACAAKEILKLPDGVEPVAFTPLGYSNSEPCKKTREPIGKLVRYETW